MLSSLWQNVKMTQKHKYIQCGFIDLFINAQVNSPV